MKKFNQERISNFNIKTKSFKHEIPVAVVKPINIDQKTSIILKVNGLARTNATEMFLADYSCFNNNYLVSYDKANYGNNKNKPSRFIFKLVREIKEVVAWIKTQFPNKKIYIIADSWGSNVACLYYKKYFNDINGLLMWNMPTKLNDPNESSFGHILSISLKLITTFLTNINFVDKKQEQSREKLTRNLVFQRIAKMCCQNFNTTRTYIAVWKSFYYARHFMKKKAKNSKYNLFYIQSWQDVMMNKKMVEKFAKIAPNKFKHLETGYHILDFEPQEYKQLDELITNFVNR